MEECEKFFVGVFDAITVELQDGTIGGWWLGGGRGLLGAWGGNCVGGAGGGIG